MKIEIDTAKDSKDELRKLIKMLQAMVEESAGYSASSSSNDMVGLGFMDLPSVQPAPSTAPISSSSSASMPTTSDLLSETFNSAKMAQQKQEKPKIEWY
jgi:hypothetical protein